VSQLWVLQWKPSSWAVPVWVLGSSQDGQVTDKQTMMGACVDGSRSHQCMEVRGGGQTDRRTGVGPLAGQVVTVMDARDVSARIRSRVAGAALHGSARVLTWVGCGHRSGLGSLELFSMGLKATGTYLSRTLAYTNAEFSIIDVDIEPRFG
jgi:P-loop containing NTP hydrolase pore-1